MITDNENYNEVKMVLFDYIKEIEKNNFFTIEKIESITKDYPNMLQIIIWNVLNAILTNEIKVIDSRLNYINFLEINKE